MFSLRSKRVASIAAAIVWVVTCGANAADASAGQSPVIEAGRYLADAAHCGACHTSRADRPFAGNLPIPSKFGTMYSSNITPDRATGIGAWTEVEFVRALRLGRGRHGEYLYPSMPYTDFTKISDDDAHALWLYFRSVDPIVERQKPNAMSFPFNVRPGIAAWQAFYFKPGRYLADDTQSAEWNRGAYLVQGLGHCGACHTPKNFAMADKIDRPLRGARTGDDWFAPNIGGGRFSGIRDWSQAQIVDYLRTGHNDKNVAAVGPMLQTIADGTRKLAAADLQAIAVYLKNQPQTVDGSGAAPAVTSDRRTAGAAVYASHCSSCHGNDGKGLDGIAPALAGNTAVGAENTIHAVIAGFVPSGRWGAMPSFAQALDSQEISDVANYVRSIGDPSMGADASVSLVNRMRDRVEIGDPRIEGALTCPEVAAASVDTKTASEIAAVATTRDDSAVPRHLFRDYRARHPQVDRSAAVSVLAGLYCRTLMTQPSGAIVDKQARVIRFTARMAADSVSGG